MSASAAVLAKIQQLQAAAEAKKQAQLQSAAGAASYVPHCSKCHNPKEKGHDVEACSPCGNWGVDDDGQPVDICDYPTEERKCKAHADRRDAKKADKLLAKLPELLAKEKAAEQRKVVVFRRLISGIVLFHLFATFTCKFVSFSRKAAKLKRRKAPPSDLLAAAFPKG